MPTTCSAMGMACTPLALVTTIPESRNSGYINCATPADDRVQPLQARRQPQLLGAQQVTHKNIGVGELGRDCVVVRQVHDAHLGPALAHALGQFGGRTPERELEISRR